MERGATWTAPGCVGHHSDLLRSSRSAVLLYSPPRAYYGTCRMQLEPEHGELWVDDVDAAQTLASASWASGSRRWSQVRSIGSSRTPDPSRTRSRCSPYARPWVRRTFLMSPLARWDQDPRWRSPVLSSQSDTRDQYHQRRADDGGGQGVEREPEPLPRRHVDPLMATAPPRQGRGGSEGTKFL